MNWRRLFGIDPAREDGGVVSAEMFYNGQIRLIDPLREYEYTAQQVPGPLYVPRGAYGLAQFRPGSLIQQLTDYKPKGNPLADKEKKDLHGLHLDDYQPRGTEFPVSRMVFERSFPQPPKMTIEELQKRRDGWMHQQNPRDWVHYRNRHPGIRDSAVGSLPPMRNAMQDLIELLEEFHQHLHERKLVAVEVAIQHEVAEQVELERQGWHYRIEALVVPRDALVAEQRQFEQTQEAIAADMAAREAEMEKHRAARQG